MSRASALPDVQLIQPVLFRPFHRDGWVYEEKYDGWRMAAFKDGRNVRLVSRRGVDHTERFAEVADAVGRLPARTLILDGEVCSSMNRSSRTCTCSWESPAAAAYSRLV